MAVAMKEKKKAEKIKLQPLGDRVVVRREEAEERTGGGIILPDAAKEKPARGEIVSVGDGKLLDDGSRGKLQVKVGDRVLFTPYGGTEVKYGGQEYLIMDEKDILGVIEG